MTPSLVTPAFVARSSAAEFSERHLRALVSIAATVAGAHELDDVLELAGEQARVAVGATFVSLSRWEVERGLLRTLMNVGDLPPGGVPRPQDEVYLLADYPLAFGLLSEGRPHVTTIDDEGADANELALLAQDELESCGAVPIRYEGRTWGELYAGTGIGFPRLQPSDISFMQAVCAQISVAIGRAELFSQVAKAAYEDPLTGLANRRALEDRLERAVEAARRDASELTVLLGDLDGLKLLNDRSGHEAGDRALAAVGAALAALAGPTVVPARIGGDEFCVLLEGAPAHAGERFADTVAAGLAAGDPAVRVSWGVASLGDDVLTPKELLRAADVAQYAAKRGGGRRTAADVTPVEAAPAAAPPAGPGAEELLAEGFTALDAIAGASGLQRASRLARVLAERLDAARWAVSVRRAGSDQLHPLPVCDRRDRAGTGTGADQSAGTAPGLTRAARDRLARPGAAVVAADASGGPDERALAQTGYDGLLVATATRGGDTYLIELFADARTAPLGPAALAARGLSAAL